MSVARGAPLLALGLLGCGALAMPAPMTGTPTHTLGDAAIEPVDADASCPGDAANSCDLPAGRYVPVVAGDARVVWQPAGGRYTNEPTVIHDDATGTWHVFSNGGVGVGNPWTETSLLHATAPSLSGPWADQPDALTTTDPGARESTEWAPFALHDGALWRLYYYGQLGATASLLAATSPDLAHWTRDPVGLPGGRDASILRLPDGRDLLYTVATTQEADGVHDAVAVFVGHGLTDWGPQQLALHNPDVCPSSCWGFYESPYVVALGGYYYLFTTDTRSVADDYENTVVFRSDDPLHFAAPPITTLQAHGAELHVEGGVMYMTRGGMPAFIGAARRGLSIVPIAWMPAP